MRNRNGSDQGTTNKEQILAKLRKALLEKPEAKFEDIDMRSDTWKPINEEDGTAITFVQHFKELGGIFIYLESEDEFGECIKQLAPQNDWEPLWCTSHKMQELLDKFKVNYCDTPAKESKQRIVSITDCDYLIANTGSIIITDQNTHNRSCYTEPDILLVMAYSNQIIGGLKEALKEQKDRLNVHAITQSVIITGATQSYDIEQEVVQGVFGPRQIAVFLIDN